MDNFETNKDNIFADNNKLYNQVQENYENQLIKITNERDEKINLIKSNLLSNIKTINNKILLMKFGNSCDKKNQIYNHPIFQGNSLLIYINKELYKKYEFLNDILYDDHYKLKQNFSNELDKLFENISKGISIQFIDHIPDKIYYSGYLLGYGCSLQKINNDDIVFEIYDGDKFNNYRLKNKNFVLNIKRIWINDLEMYDYYSEVYNGFENFDLTSNRPHYFYDVYYANSYYLKLFS